MHLNREALFSWRTFVRTIGAVCFLYLLALAIESPCSAADRPQMRLRLKNGSYLSGQLENAERAGHIGWRNENFLQPFEFDARAVRSITRLAEPGDFNLVKKPESGQLFLLKNGSTLSGELMGLDDKTVTIESQSLGRILVSRSMLQEMESANFEGRLIYVGPKNSSEWVQKNKGSEWVFEAGALVSSKSGQSILGDVGLPDRCQITLVLTWRGAPEFVLYIGSDLDPKGDHLESAARLECWNQQLVLIREIENGADVAPLSNASREETRMEIVVLMDQAAGVVAVYDPRGKLLGKIELASKKHTTRKYVQIANQGQQLRLERLEVRHWDGHLREPSSNSENQIVDEKGETILGAIVAYDSQSRMATLAGKDGKRTQIPLASIRRAVFEQGPSEGGPAGERPAVEQSDSTKPRESSSTPVEKESSNEKGTAPPEERLRVDQPAPMDPAAVIRSQGKVPTVDGRTVDGLLEIQLNDRSRLIGSWIGSVNSSIRFQADGITEPIQVNPSNVIEIVGSAEKFAAGAPSNVAGRLQLSSVEMLGSLVDSDTVASPLVWQPESSATASSLTQNASGSIVYRVPEQQKIARVPQPAVRPNPAAAAAGAAAQLLLGAGRPAVPIVPAPQVNQRAGAKVTREIAFRTGDTILGTIESIDERGVLFASENTKTTFVKHEQMQTATLLQTAAGTVSPDKMNRLMTVPRMMKKDPPTHMIISSSGDYLRGRLVKMDDKILTMEIRLEMVDIPRDQVAQIIWLHDRKWSVDERKDEVAESEPEKAASLAPFLVHGVRARQQGMTFLPLKMMSGVLMGTSDLLGDCETKIADLEQLLFGHDVGSKVREIKQQGWELSLAPMPKVYLDEETGAQVGNPMAGTLSPMVGKKAPDFSLKMLDGKPFKLSQNRDRIVILDFWASWCGPCIQTMPEIDRIVKEIGADKVHLVAVNLQETAERAKATVERLGLSSTVVLDSDGEIALVYDATAIPQTVIIDRNGNVTHLFVGGGSRFVEGFAASLKQVLEPKE